MMQNNIHENMLPHGLYHLDERVCDVTFTDDMFWVYLADGRILAVPIKWYPRLLNAHPEQRMRWGLSDDAETIIWAALDERIGIAELLWEGSEHHEADRERKRVAHELAANDEQNSEALEWIEGCIGDVLQDEENEEEQRAHALAWAEEILRRYKQ